MIKRTVLALALVAIISSSAVASIASAQASPVLSISNMILLPQNYSDPGQEITNFTVYVPQSSFTQSLIGSRLDTLGITPSVYGNLWTFSVPGSISARINDSLRNLSEKFGISYFSSNSTPLAYPSLQSLNATQEISVPFAFTPSLIAKAYNFTWPLSHGINGIGQTIVIIDAFGDPNIAYDIKAFDAINNLPPVDLQVTYPLGQPLQYNATWAMETATDVEWAHALAPYAKIVLLISASAYTSDLQQLVSYAVSHRLGNVMSLSWGTPEQELGQTVVNTYSQIFKQAASDGIDIFAASGDNGAYSGTNELAVNFPASDPSVTGVGGTSLYVLSNKFNQYGWGGLFGGKSYGSGGGFSTYFSTPLWQKVKGYDSTMRGVPDVAAVADKYTGVYVISGGGQYMVGGTSVATPIWADVAALILQYTGQTLDSLNPLLYQIARTSLYNSSFTQIVSGTNGYYKDTPYWNPVTGLGTPKVASLLNSSKEILGGYGGVALLNGTGNYNGTSISAAINLTVNTANLAGNGTTFYYIGFYQNRTNFVKFGIAAAAPGDYLELEVSQGSHSFYRTYALPSGYGTSFSDFLLTATYDGKSLAFSTTGGFSGNVPAFLNYSGKMSPAVGVEQVYTQTNLTDISTGDFSNIQTYQNGSWHNATYVFFEHYSAYDSGTYSTVDAKYVGDGLSFYYSSAEEYGLIGPNMTKSPEITYAITYGYPLELQLKIENVQGTVSWDVNGTPLGSDVFQVPISGGIFSINATFVDGNGNNRQIERTIYLPGVIEPKFTVNYSMPAGTPTPQTTVTVMWFYGYQFPAFSRVPMINSTNQLNLTAYGFYPFGGESLPYGNISVQISPKPVNVSVFVFPGNANVSMNGIESARTGGLHYANILPAGKLQLNVTAPGFTGSTKEITMSPGQNLSLQMTLFPASQDYVVVSGSVTDILYSFSIENAKIQFGNGTYAYSNSTGYYILFTEPGKYNVTASAELYNNYSTPLNITSNTVLNIKLKPSEVSLSTTQLVGITHYFPFLFYFGFISWSDYKGANFSIYQIYISTSSDFINPSVMTISSQNTSYAFLTGIVPGNSYYISIVLRLTNNQVFQSQVVKITYSDPVYLGVNLVLAGAIGFYAYMAYRIFRKKG